MVTMTYSLLRFVHLVGLTLMGAGLIGVWLSDLRSRKVRDLVRFDEAIRNVAMFYDGVVVPGALILFFSGAWMTADLWGGWGFTQHLVGLTLMGAGLIGVWLSDLRSRKVRDLVRFDAPPYE